MPKAFDLKPIKPSRKITAVDTADVVKLLRNYAARTVRRMGADYEKVTPSPRYRRTGTLGRGWTFVGPRKKGNDLAVEVGNNVEYAGYAQGFTPDVGGDSDEHQTRVMSQRGWAPVNEVAREEWDRIGQELEDMLTSKAT